MKLSKKKCTLEVKSGKAIVIFLLISCVIWNKTSAKQSKVCESKECLFSSYIKEHNVRFKSPLEKVYRFRIFQKNLREIETFNKTHPHIKLNFNDFGLLTRKEFKQKMTNPDFLFVDDNGQKRHVNVEDPRNQVIADQNILKTNTEALDAIKTHIAKKGRANALVMLEWDIKDADAAIEKELERIHDFLNQQESQISKQANELANNSKNAPKQIKANLQTKLF